MGQENRYTLHLTQQLKSWYCKVQ